MRPSEIRSVAKVSGLPLRFADQPAIAVVRESRALTVVMPSGDSDHEVARRYRLAAFLAQLIATKDRHPQTRARRRAEPYEAIAAYRAVAMLVAHR
jgi:hypothetical protein